jgi:hypothetical protein
VTQAASLAERRDRQRSSARRRGIDGPGRWWRPALVVIGFAGFSFALSLALEAKDSDLDVFFWPAAELAAHGHPLLIYTLQAGPYTNANGPLALVPLTLVALVANALGWAADPQLRDGLALAAFSVFILLMAREAAGLVATSGARRDGRAVYAALCLSLPLWLALGSFGHVEVPLELWLSLVALRWVLRGRVVAAGVVLGLVVLTRSADVVTVLCLALVAATAAPGRSPGRAALRCLTLLGVAAATALAGLLPFLVADPRGVVDSLVGFRGALPISGGSAWVLLARGLPWAGVVQGYDTVIFGGAALILAGAVAWRARAQPMTLTRAAAALTVAALCVPLLAKTTWAYYLADPCVFSVLWALSTPATGSRWRWAVPGLLSVLSVALAATGLSTPPTTPQVALGVTASALIGLALVAVLGDASRPTVTSAAPERWSSTA